MKRILAIILAALLTVSSLASCTAEPDNGGSAGSDTVIGSDTTIEGDNNATEETKNDSTDKATDKEEDKDDNTETEKPTFDVTESTSGLAYVLNEDKLSYTVVGKGTSTSKSIVIDGHNGLPVTRVGYSAFGDNKSITSVKLGDYVEIVDDQAFSQCSALTSVTFGTGVKLLGDYSFRYCTSLTSIELGKNIEVIKYGAFYNCQKLATIRMFGNVRLIEDYAFDKTAYYNDSSHWKSNVLFIGNNLIEAKNSVSNTYTVPTNTTCIAALAFSTCASLTKVVIPDSVHSIGPQAFQDTTKLNTITIGKGVTYIGEKAFYNSGFHNNSDNWKSNVLYVGNYIVDAKTGLSGGYTVTSGTKAIADMAFADCASLTSISIPDSVVYIGEYAFRGCTKLGTVVLGTGVKEIGILAFKDCAALKNITVNDASGWKAGNISVSSNILSSKTDAAMYIGILYSDKVWKNS